MALGRSTNTVPEDDSAENAPNAPPSPTAVTQAALEALNTFHGSCGAPLSQQQPATAALGSHVRTETLASVPLLNGGHSDGQSAVTEGPSSPSSVGTATLQVNGNEHESASESPAMLTDRNSTPLSATMLRWLAERPHEEPWSIHDGLGDVNNNRDEQQRPRISAFVRRCRHVPRRNSN